MAWGNPLPVVGNLLWVAVIVYSGRWRAWVGNFPDRLLSAVWATLGLGAATLSGQPSNVLY